MGEAYDAVAQQSLAINTWNEEVVNDIINIAVDDCMAVLILHGQDSDTLEANYSDDENRSPILNSHWQDTPLGRFFSAAVKCGVIGAVPSKSTISE